VRVEGRYFESGGSIDHGESPPESP
jgi:hypothetical protein